MPELWKHVKWSLEQVWHGKWASKNVDGAFYDADSAEGILGGTYLAGGFRGVMYLLSGDIKHFHEGLGMRCCTGLARAYRDAEPP